MLRYIDSHAHYDDPAFDSDRDQLLVRLHESCLIKLINIGCTEQSSKNSVRLAEKYDFVYAAVGIHPENAGEQSRDYLDVLRSLSRSPKTVAIGEIGLDRHEKGSDLELQKRIFREQLALARELDLPVVIHSRDAAKDTADILKEFRPRGVVHCFSGSPETAAEILRLGMYLGFTGNITFKNARRAEECIRNAPLDRILAETDCPYMAPEPFRGKRSDSGMIAYSLERIAEIKGITPEKAAEAVTENALRLFEKMK